MVAEARVGILLLVFALLTVGTLVYLSGRWGFVSGQLVRLHFRNVEGLTEGAKVMLEGMEVGRVVDIELATPEDLEEFPERQIVARVLIRKGIQLFDTDDFVISQAGLLGDNHVLIRRKTAKEREEEARLLNKPVRQPAPLQAPVDLTGEKQIGIAELGGEAREVMQQVKGAIADFQTVYAGPDIRERLPAILANVELATTHAIEFSQLLARVSLENEGQIKVIAGEIAAASKELNASAERVHRLVMASAPNVEGATARVARMIDATALNVEAASAHAARTGERVEKLADLSAADIEASTRMARNTLAKTSANLERAAERIETMVSHSAENIDKTTGYVEETTRVASADLAAAAKRARELIEKSSGSLEVAAAQVEKTTTAMAELVDRSGKDISASTGRVNAMVQKSAGDVEKASANLAKMSANAHADLTAIMRRTASMVEQSSGDIEKTTARIARLTEASAEDIEKTTKRIREMIEASPLPADLAAAGTHIRRATENVEAITKGIADPELTGRIRATVSNLEKTSGHLVAMAEQGTLLVKDTREAVTRTTALATDDEIWNEIRQTVKQMRQAVANLEEITAHGKTVLTDPKLTEDITKSVANIRELTTQGIEVAAKADRSLERVDTTMDKMRDFTRRLQPSRSRSYASLEAARTAGLRGDIVSDMYFGAERNDYWRIGVRDIGDAERLVLQKGLPAGSRATFRLGILANKLGVGYDYPLGNRLSLELDLWDPDDVKFDARGLMTLGRQWDLLFGANAIFSDTDPFIGLRRNVYTGTQR